MHPDHDLEQFYTQSHLPGVPRPFHQLPPEERIDWGRKMEKAQFEAALKSGAFDEDRVSDFANCETEAAWRGWQAARAHTPQPTTQFEAWAKLHHYDLTRCSHEPYAAYRSDLTNAALAGWRGANGETAPQAPSVPVELSGVKEALEGGDGFWRTCSGCHETEDGHDVGHYPFSDVLNCTLGGGCSECGGLGAVWDNTDYDDMAEFCERWMASAEQFEEWWHEGAHPFRNVGGTKDLQLTQEMARSIWDAARATAPQPDHYQQLLGVAYVVLGCLAANGVDIPERFLGAFSDPDSVENPLELLPCDFSPARVVRAAVEGAALTDERAAIEELRNIANAKRFDHEMFADDTEFADWAQSRARHTLVHVTAPESSVPMELNCPSCAEPHVDIGEWATRPHKTHQCQKCGREWRPFAYTTVGIAPQATFECAARKNKVDALHIWEASRATAMEEAAQTALSKLKDLTTEMEGYSYFGSNPGVKEDDYDDVADAIRALAKGESE